MPTKKRYTINDKVFLWKTEDGDEVTLPMRIKLKVVRSMASDDLDASSMFAILDTIAPGQDAVLDEMDLNDFQAMFTAWQSEYEALSGASLGE